MRASHKFKRNPECRVRICRYRLPARKKGVGKSLRPDRPDLNLEEQVFSHCTQRRKKRVGVKGGCGEKDRYDAAQMVRFTHTNSDGDDLDEEDIEGDEEDCDDDPKKVGRNPHLKGRGVNGE
ncbi:hypothetical protein R1sor_025541 [Riccia sorocarpa]|uniref:Uncharacterized protein n=1 Tax=Riccia sorocarpa TaxID=122646 RepID=A0ABD3G9E8_9MARC